MLEKVLGKRRATMKAWSMMYKAVVQVVLLYVSEIWVMTDVTMTVLEVFHHMIARWIEEMTIRRGARGE